MSASPSQRQKRTKTKSPGHTQTASTEMSESPDRKVPPAPRNSIGDLFSKGLGIAKQYVLQKMDKAIPTEETKEFKEKAKAFETSRIGLEELYTKASGFLQASVTSNTSFADFSSTTAKLGSHSKADPKSAAVVQSFVPYALQLQGHNAKFNDTYRDLVVRPLQNLLQNEVKQTVILKSIGCGSS
jgi:hypothetical protein